ncbi:MAG: class I SAM-dependent methyltransferase [Nitrospirota bacterium]|nr:class I SAM-dependent methyltransferase [Nitrospirota bacterium]
MHDGEVVTGVVADQVLQVVDNDFRCDACPLCGARRIRKVGEIPRLESVPYASIQVRLMRDPELWHCLACASRFVRNSVREADSARLYGSSNSGDRWRRNRPFHQEKTAGVVRRVAQVCKAGETLLDVGCNTGDLLDFARSQGCVTYGIEFSGSVHPQLREKGHQVIGDPLAEGEGYFDVITAFDLIEHLYDVNGFLKVCGRALRIGGKLVILTGDPGCVPARLAGGRWWYVAPPEHIVFPSRRFLSGLDGWRVAEWHRCYNSVAWVRPLLTAVRANLSAAVHRRYNGHPSPWPDHVLAVLEKVG